jgi:uncharacterized protein YfaP (DUF2135 family)
MSILFLLPLLALPLSGCDNPPWDGGMVLVLKVDMPKEGEKVSASPITVSGRVSGTESNAAKVSVNGTDVPVKDGKYSTTITLNDGQNVINIVAASGQAKLTEKRTVIYAPAK